MGLFSRLADKVGDRFGILNDADDYFDRSNLMLNTMAGKVKAVARVYEQLKDAINGADELTDFTAGEYQQGRAIIKDLNVEAVKLVRDSLKLTRKAKKDIDIWRLVRGRLVKANTNLRNAAAKINNLVSDFVKAERDQKQALRELAEEMREHKNPVKARRKMARIAGGVAGSLTALAVLLAGLTI